MKLQRIHLAKVKRLHKHLKENIPTIILGDLNDIPSSPAVAFLKNNGFSDSSDVEVAENSDKKITWRWVIK